ncbi:MAG TPA: 4Fe-4S dicluster domain-containing protein [Armatimonadetes bacterium]|nr:4Fe-4S dicluster domain-containing protein [Armatimonadota bacterium]
MNLSADLTSAAAQEFVREIEESSGEDIAACYQCGKCTAGCPLAFAMDLDPARVMRLVQLGQREMVLQSHTIWLCASCETCTTRCPQEVDVARVMDALRRLAREEGYTAAEREVALFNENFLRNVCARGRVHELELVLRQNLRSGHLFRDAGKGPLMLAKGKFSLRVPKTKEVTAIWRIFENLEKRRGEKA